MRRQTECEHADAAARVTGPNQCSLLYMCVMKILICPEGLNVPGNVSKTCGERKCKFAWRKLSAFQFDGASAKKNILAHTFFPGHSEPLNGDIHFDDAETWETDLTAATN